MRNRVKWVDELCFLGETASGHSIVMDGSVEKGGRDRGARPLELLLMGSAGCLFFDIISILKKAREDVRDGWIDIDQTQAENLPRVYTKIHFHIVLVGRNIKPAAVERAIDLSVEKYCSASIMLSKAVEMTRSYEIRELD